MTVIAGRFLILLLVAGMGMGNFTLNLAKNKALPPGQPSLASVIKNVQYFQQINSPEQASQQMRAMIVALQSASGLLVARKSPGTERTEVVAFFFKLPFLFSSSAALQASLDCIHLAPVDWCNNYSSIQLDPPSPPPLFLS